MPAAELKHESRQGIASSSIHALCCVAAVTSTSLTCLSAFGTPSTTMAQRVNAPPPWFSSTSALLFWTVSVTMSPSDILVLSHDSKPESHDVSMRATFVTSSRHAFRRFIDIGLCLANLLVPPPDGEVAQMARSRAPGPAARSTHHTDAIACRTLILYMNKLRLIHVLTDSTRQTTQTAL